MDSLLVLDWNKEGEKPVATALEQRPELSLKAGEMLSKLVPDIQKTSELVQEISAASAEQNSGVGQINQSLQQLDRIIQQNASASEEMAAAAEELSTQSGQLQSSMSFFKVKGGSQTRIISSSRAPGRFPEVAVADNHVKQLDSATKKINNKSASPVKELPGVGLDMKANDSDDSAFVQY